MKYIRWIVLSPLLAGIWCAMRSPDMGEAYARMYILIYRVLCSCFSSLFSFSIGDCLIYGSMAGLLAYLVYAIVKKRSWRATAGRMIEYLLWIYVWFYLAWGLNYFRKDFFYTDGNPVCGLFSRRFSFVLIHLYRFVECVLCACRKNR